MKSERTSVPATHRYITIEEALGATDPEHVSGGSDDSRVIAILNALPMIPGAFDDEVAAFAQRLPSLFTDVDSITITPTDSTYPEPRPSERHQRKKRRRSDWKKKAVTTDTATVRNGALNTWVVAEPGQGGEIVMPCPGNAGEPIATVTFYPPPGVSLGNDTIESLPAVMNFITFVLTDLQARCWFLESRHLPTIEQIAAKIADDAELTEQDYCVLRLILKGATYNEAARELGLSVETVKKHMKKIYDRTNTMGLANLFGRYASTQM